MSKMSKIKVGIIGVGNCAKSLVEGIQYYKSNPEDKVVKVEEILQKLAVYLANELDKRSNLLQRIEDLENEVSELSRYELSRDDVVDIVGECQILEDDVRDWISDAINNTTATLEAP